jgi:ABC-type transporter Mla subunit MlaD
MSKKASPTLIGIFTLVGLLIAGAGIVLFGAGKYFTHTHKLLLYFQKSANGLSIGSDVRFAGVKIGSVKEISVIIDSKEKTKILPVLVELVETDLLLVSTEAGNRIDFSSFAGVDRAVKQGLRGTMKAQSMVTGQLYIEFDIAPETPGYVYDAKGKHLYPVVPTVGTDIDEILSRIGDTLKKFNALDLTGVLTDFRGVLVGAKDQIAALNLKQINDNVIGITEDVRKITSDEKLTHAVANLDEALVQIKEVAAKANNKFDPLMGDLDDVIAKMDTGLLKIDAAAKSMSDISNPRSPVLLRLQNVLQETERASRALKELSNDLKREPNALISGKAATP